jgi:hypothetical protein
VIWIKKSFRDPFSLHGLGGPLRFGSTDMTTLTTLTIVAALLAGGTSLAMAQSATTKHHHRVTHLRPAIYNMVPDAIGVCPANGGPSCSNQGPAPPDSW